ncbi:unnamed protein product [Ectocarpus sp. CCAP 1310/34]|nr:unnamed protein product [Ectocarpus sp. CCAP 1310/34]
MGWSGGGGSCGGNNSSTGATSPRRSVSSAMAGTTSSSQQGEDGNGGRFGWSPSSPTTPAPSLQQGSGRGGVGNVDYGMGFMGNSSGDENLTTEDPYVRPSLNRAIIELSDTCHRLLSFKV